ncbi:hypothetical protein MOB47_02570 [Bacillus inaquosorum]|uniref:Uncharacterized protein n=1 Tax=Bacillus inaquosorum TaxID=483913 RepID=A0A9Q4EP16_9BACI|nr:hypothetical protein [Bacillus inaquosorum]MCY7785611.1 hypothetical protein [Bacillus inaquosorum]MCY7819328.1 hypothetical protein [Bacillus inaquosorum]MCY7939412.1 hypothetical protein [Bacillus inaquosorum]MCY8028394.1 hypothetical protein [Bacillus inaquosorum]MCY8083298.1 hypothetical protein [Bacillus inaquosorum]
MKSSFFQVIQKETSNIYGYILIVDSKRKGKLCDNPVLAGIEDENEYEGSSNFIQVIAFTEERYLEDFTADTFSFIDGLLNMKPDCRFFIKEQIYKSNSELLDFDFPFDMTPIVDFITPYVQEVSKDINLNNISNRDFNYLSQK